MSAPLPSFVSSLLALAIAGSTAVAQGVPSAGVRRPVAQNDDCRNILRPFTPAGTVAGGTRTTAVTFHGLEDLWKVDQTAAARDLSAFLVANPAVLGSVSAAADECGRRRCSCPRPARVPAASLFKQSSDLLAYGLRGDSAGALTALVLFLQDHPEVIRRASGSLRQIGSPNQRREFAAAERKVNALISRQPR